VREAGAPSGGGRGRLGVGGVLQQEVDGGGGGGGGEGAGVVGDQHGPAKVHRALVGRALGEQGLEEGELLRGGLAGGRGVHLSSFRAWACADLILRGGRQHLPPA